MAYKKDTGQLEETVVKINRCTNVTKGGKSIEGEKATAEGVKSRRNKDETQTERPVTRG